MDRITIVGASLAGLRAAETLRREGHAGTICLIGDEPHLPYDRPPLSKQVLAGTWEPERATLIDADSSASLGIDWRLGVRAVSLDTEARVVHLADGDQVPYDGLIIATGARCRTLAGTEDIAGVHTLRTIDDCAGIRAALASGPVRVVVVGAGFIGAEVAATARSLGHDVTMVEAATVPFERILGRDIGRVVTDVHRDHGVDVRTGVGVRAIEGGDRVERVLLDDGTGVPADLVVVGVGVVANTEWLDGSGLTVDDGVVCDETCLAAPGIVAAGDVARWHHRRFGETMRVEHWDNAVEQGIHAARRLLGITHAPYEPVPWFWSDQYDRKFQLAGRTRPGDTVAVVDGDLGEHRFAVAYGREGHLVGVFGCNRPRQVMQYRGLIADGATWDDAIAFGRG